MTASSHIVSSSSASWSLVPCVQGGANSSPLRFARTPVTLGRSSEADVLVADKSVSKRHAQLSLTEEGPHVLDLGSTNGTFVNGERRVESLLREGDFVQFGEVTFRVKAERDEDFGGTVESQALSWTQSLLHFDELVSFERFDPHFQPIVKLPAGERVGFELLARSSVPGLENPATMFAAAETLNQEVPLSELLRRCGARAAMTLPGSSAIFVNSHPSEAVGDRFLASLRDLRAASPDLDLVVEVHEGAVADVAAMRRLRDQLNALDMRLAYDDFGAGQARLEELVDVPPDVLKFDMRLIRGIDTAGASRQDLVESLVRVSKNLGVTTLAEGIETAGEAEVCVSLGFELAQGYFYGKPAPTKAYFAI